MPFTPAPPFPKSSGDNIRSTDWNELIAELIRLDTAKTNRTGGDTFSGPLTIGGGRWDVNATEGDFRIGNDTFRMKIGVALGGGGAGDVRMRAVGGTNRLMLGGGDSDTLTIQNDQVGIGASVPQSKLDVRGFTRSLGVSVNDGTNSGVGRGVWLWSPTDPNHAIYSANPSGKSPADRPAVRGFFDAGHRFRLRTATGQGFLFENNGEQALVDIDADNGDFWTKGAHYCGGSALYFTETTRSHTGIGNTAGFAAIENAANFNTLMILGRAVSTSPLRRSVSVWDELNVFGTFKTQGAHTIKVGHPSPNGSYGNDGIRGEPNLWLDAAGTVLIKQGFQARGMDIAERFPAGDPLNAGDVVIFEETDRRVRRCDRQADRRAVGIVSADAAFILGVDDAEVPVALCGRVPCKVDADVAPIEAGDLLTTSQTPGHAQKVTDPVGCTGAIIGKALTSLSEGKGEVLVLVHLR